MHGVIFVTSLSEYNLNLFEAPDVNRLEESTQLWANVAGGPVFRNSALLLFLNKFDLFQKKYFQDRIPLHKVPGFSDPPIADDEENENCDIAVNWFKELYLDQVPEERKAAVSYALRSRLISNDCFTGVYTHNNCCLHSYHGQGDQRRFSLLCHRNFEVYLIVFLTLCCSHFLVNF